MGATESKPEEQPEERISPVRRLEAGDFHKGYMELLAQLSKSGEVSEAAFAARVDEMQQLGYYTAVIEDLETGKIIGTATLLIEVKLLRGCGKAGHIEDVVVDQAYRGLRLGQRLIEELLHVAGEAGCYKVILDCTESNVPFYEKCGLERKEVQMVKYL